MINWNELVGQEFLHRERIFNDEQIFDLIITKDRSLLNRDRLNPIPQNVAELYDVLFNLLNKIRPNGEPVPILYAVNYKLPDTPLHMDDPKDQYFLVTALGEFLALAANNPCMATIVSIMGNGFDLEQQEQLVSYIEKNFTVVETKTDEDFLREGNVASILVNDRGEPCIYINKKAEGKKAKALLHEAIAFLIMFPEYTGKYSLQTLQGYKQEEIEEIKRRKLGGTLQVGEYFIRDLERLLEDRSINHILKPNF